MLPDFYIAMSMIADLVLFMFVGYYLLRLRVREKEVEKKESKIDKDYHHVVDDALSKERQIIDDATSEADKILLETQMMSQSSQSSIDQALEAMMVDLKKDSANAAETYRKTYHESLKQVTAQSLKDFQTISKELEESLHKEISTFHNTMLPTLEKELAGYKEMRMKQTEAMIKDIIQKVSQEMLNKSISIDDHQKLLLASLDKAKREGTFD